MPYLEDNNNREIKVEEIFVFFRHKLDVGLLKKILFFATNIMWMTICMFGFIVSWQNHGVSR